MGTGRSASGSADPTAFTVFFPKKLNPPDPFAVVILEVVHAKPDQTQLAELAQIAASLQIKDLPTLEQLAPRPQRRLQVAQTLSKRELSKRHREPLIVTCKVPDSRVSVITLNAASKDLAVAQAHYLREHSLSGHTPRMRSDRDGRIPNASHPPTWVMR